MFSVKGTGAELTVQRIDSDGGWAMHLRFMCIPRAASECKPYLAGEILSVPLGVLLADPAQSRLRKDQVDCFLKALLAIFGRRQSRRRNLNLYFFGGGQVLCTWDLNLTASQETKFLNRVRGTDLSAQADSLNLKLVVDIEPGSELQVCSSIQSLHGGVNNHHADIMDDRSTQGPDFARPMASRKMQSLRKSAWTSLHDRTSPQNAVST